MKINEETVVKSTVDQGVASWINHLNQVRLTEFITAQKAIAEEKMNNLASQGENFRAALNTVEETWQKAQELLRTPTGGMRGGITGIHGFLAEIGEVGIGNAESQVSGGEKIYEWLNDNGPWDFVRKASDSGSDILIQQKFQAGTVDHMSLQALLDHLEKYPDSLDVGGKYQIPKDHYDKFIKLMNISQDEANKLSTQTGEFSKKEWEYVQKFIEDKKIPLDKIEPSKLTYAEAQAGKFEETLENEKAKLSEINDRREQQINDEAKSKKDAAYAESKPSFSEGAKATMFSAAIEGGISLGSAIIKKRKSGKKYKEFTTDDWKEIAGDSGKGVVKGGIRGSTVYLLTNFTATPASVATSFVTASFGVSAQLKKYRKGECTGTQFIENSEKVCLDTVVSAYSAFAGELLIPVPILGAIIGNAVGTLMYQITCNLCDKHEQKLIAGYLDSIDKLEGSLEEEYGEYIRKVNEDFENFMALILAAFSPDVRAAFEGSVKLAQAFGISDNKVLHDIDETRRYFLD